VADLLAKTGLDGVAQLDGAVLHPPA